MIKNIKLAFDIKVNSITPTIETAYEGVPFTPTNGVPYQELYLLPALNINPNMDNSEWINRGIYQITLKYPDGAGVVPILDRVALYENNFTKGTTLTNGNVKVIIDSVRSVNLGKDGDRIVYAISINYKGLKI